MGKYSIVTSCYNQRDNFPRIMNAWADQTTPHRDWEIIIGDDGGSDDMEEYANRHGLGYVWHEDKGYRFTEIMNKACELATGDYIIFMNGDSYPHPDFLDEMDRVIKPNRVANGFRINVDWESRKEIVKDWRMFQLPESIAMLHVMGVEMYPIGKIYQRPWELMTLTALAIPREMFFELGGLTPIYNEGYGRMDWSLAMKAHFSGYELWHHTGAIVYHEYNPKSREDTEKNILSFEKELNEWQKKKQVKTRA